MSTSKSVNDLFQQAQTDGLLSAASAKAIQIVDPGAQIQNSLGVKVDDVQASEVVLVTMLIDDSGSIRFGSNSDAVRDGHNLVLDALSKSKQKDNVLVHCRYLNGKVLYPYCALDAAVRMDNHNYDPHGVTPLYDQTVGVLATVLAKSQEFAQNGVPVRTVTLILTDGHDEGSRRADIPACASIIKDLKMAETHIVCAMGVDDGSTNFGQIFSDMGVEPSWILTPKNNQSEIRKAFQVFSQSAVRASQSAASFSKTAVGGFAAP